MAKSVDAPIEIIRDQLGVPHCFAGSERDAFFAQGWVHAADRLWQMDYDRRRAQGRWAAVVGPAGVASDVFYRRIGLASCVRRDLAELAPETRAMLDAYSAGVNAWIERGELTKEFAAAGVIPADWEPWHSLLVYRVRHVLMGSARTKLWRAIVADTLGEGVARTMVAGHGDEQIACVPPGEPATGLASGLGDGEGGSNNWALAGSRTASGLPLLAGDPHRELEAANVYVQGHIACPEWNVLGIGMPGVPGFPHFGHTDRVAWSITHAMADDQDLYLFDDRSPALEPPRSETIEVAGADPVAIEIINTPRGPIIGSGLALSWTATVEPNLGFDALVPMLRAQSVDELFASMRSWVEPVNSLLGADVDGTIGYLTRGRIPRRRRLDAAWFPVPGDDESFTWDGWVPFEEMPRCMNPKHGFLFSANNQIPVTAADPYIGLDVAAPWRARRLVARLRETNDATVDDMAALHADVVSLPAKRFAVATTWDPLTGWDGEVNSDSETAARYGVLRRELFLVVLERSGLGARLDDPRNRLLPGVVPESALWRVVEQHLHRGDESLLGGATWEQVVAEAVTRTEATWSGERWGALHQTAHRHALGRDDFDPPRVAVSGDMDTVLAAGYTPTAGFGVKHGSVARYAFDLGDWDRSAWVVPLGAAGEPGAEHAYDQQAAWADVRLFPAPYSRASVEAAASSRTTLAP